MLLIQGRDEYGALDQLERIATGARRRLTSGA
jgi:hypothetical protein